MKTFTVTLYDSLRNEDFDAITQFIGADDTGAFGILPGHVPMVAVLRYGLARFRDRDGKWHYLALPGGVLHFAANTLSLVTERYFMGEQREALADQLADELAREDSDLHAARLTMEHIEQTLITRLSQLNRQKEEVRR